MQSHVFGYGSLVNSATHALGPLALARLDGWQRVWVHLPGRDFATLSVELCAGAVIDGLSCAVDPAAWPALDQREAAYARITVQATLANSIPHAAALYVARRADGQEPTVPILLSYLDAVVQGFHRRYGAAGVARFFASTAGWQAGVCDDRAAPLYPRAQPLSAPEREAVDAALRSVAAPRQPPPRPAR